MVTTPGTKVLGQTLLPVPLSKMVSQLATSGLHLDLSIGGIPFNVKMSQNEPMLRGMVDDRKQMFDPSNQAGEQSFGYWWLRSMASFHLGAGQEFMDTGTVDPQRSRVRFSTSNGLDHSTVGKLTVFPAYNYGSTQGGVVYAASCPVTRGGVQQIALMRTDSSKVDFFDANAHTYSTVTLAGGIPQAMCTDGNRVFVVVNNSIVRINADNSLTTIATLTLSSPVAIGFAKSRIIFGHGPALYEVDANGSSVALGAGQLKYTHPNPSWQWNVIYDGPNGIFTAGYSGPVSCLFSMTVTDPGTGTLQLGSPLQQASLPNGERIQGMIFYINSIFVLATNMGLRIGWFTFYGQPQWGANSSPGVSFTTLAAFGTLLYAGTSDNRIFCFNLAYTADDSGRYSYVQVASAAPEALIGLATTGSTTQVYSITNNRVGFQDSTITTAGTMTTSWITWTTTEPKRAHYLTISGSFPGPASTVTVSTRSGASQTFAIPGGTTQTSFEYGLAGLAVSDAFQVTVNLNQDNTGQNVFRSWQLKALPQPRRYQQLIYPLLIADSELCSSGEQIGYNGFAADRLNQLESLARANAVVTVRDRLIGQQYECMVQGIQFKQEQGPEPTKPIDGIATIILTLVA